MLPEHYRFTVHHGEQVHLGVTGSIAAFKSLELLRTFLELDLMVSVTLTEAAQRFVTPLSFEALGATKVYTSMWDGGDSAFGHLEPAQEARCLVIAPATADFIARYRHGIADDLLTTQALAFQGPVLLAPAMNPRLWDAWQTKSNVADLAANGVFMLTPGNGLMACGEEGRGRLPEIHSIVAQTLKSLTPQDMAGSKVLVSLGPTREYFDPVRYWSNPSTGLMGACLAMSAWMRGADVTVVHGPVSLDFPAGITRIPVQSARDMFTACTDIWPDQHIAMMTAAVSDFSPVPYGDIKFKKRTLNSESISLEFSTNPDILRTLGEHKKPHQKLLGFCAETSELEKAAAAKLNEKNCDLMVANNVGVPGSGFATPSNQVYVLDSAGRSEHWPQLPKTEVAWRLLEWMRRLLP